MTKEERNKAVVGRWFTDFWGTADLIAEGDHVVGQWEGGGTHTGPAFTDFLVGALPAATGRKRFLGPEIPMFRLRGIKQQESE